jgi:hypothetical protein
MNVWYIFYVVSLDVCVAGSGLHCSADVLKKVATGLENGFDML